LLKDGLQTGQHICKETSQTWNKPQDCLQYADHCSQEANHKTLRNGKDKCKHCLTTAKLHKSLTCHCRCKSRRIQADGWQSNSNHFGFLEEKRTFELGLCHHHIQEDLPLSAVLELVLVQLLKLECRVVSFTQLIY
jgi:hypothetical protein